MCLGGNSHSREDTNCVMARSAAVRVERLLSMAEAAELLGTKERFPRRLIAQRIRCIHVGRHVRTPESADRLLPIVST